MVFSVQSGKNGFQPSFCRLPSLSVQVALHPPTNKATATTTRSRVSFVFMLFPFVRGYGSTMDFARIASTIFMTVFIWIVHYKIAATRAPRFYPQVLGSIRNFAAIAPVIIRCRIISHNQDNVKRLFGIRGWHQGKYANKDGEKHTTHYLQGNFKGLRVS